MQEEFPNPLPAMPFPPFVIAIRLCGQRRSQATRGISRLRGMKHRSLCFDPVPVPAGGVTFLAQQESNQRSRLKGSASSRSRGVPLKNPPSPSVSAGGKLSARKPRSSTIALAATGNTDSHGCCRRNNWVSRKGEWPLWEEAKPSYPWN